MGDTELAQKILDMIKEMRDDVWRKPISETYEVDQQSALIEDIEMLCKEQVEANKS